MLDAPNEKKKADYFELYKETTTRVVGTVLVIVAIVQLVIIIYLLTKASTVNYCSSDSDYFQPRDFINPGLFDDLTPDELHAVNNFMLHDTHLNLTSWETAVINSSYIYMIELFLPIKSDVLNFIERGLKRPIREAKVVVFRGNLQPPRVEEFIVSPLPHPTSYRIYKDLSFRRDPIPFNSRPSDAVEVSAAATLINSVTEKLYSLLIESYGLCYHNCTKGVNCMKIFDTAPRGLGSGDRKTWVWLFPDIEDFYNYPLGLEILINHESVNTRNWSVDLIVYNGQAFTDVDSLMEAYMLGRLKKINYHDHSDISRRFGHPYEIIAHSEQGPGPTHFEPSGKRFRVEGRSLTYNNWQLTLNMRPSTGLQIYNVMFAGSRIAYEISLQELVVFYTGYGPAQGNTHFYDSSLMIGASSMELVRGIDCPHNAVYLDSHFWVNSGTYKRTKNNICVFERNSELPVHRHYTDDYEDGYEYFRGTPNYHLVVRTIATIWNYDYIFDYIFYNNGAIEVKVSLTGYVQSTFTLQQEDNYGNVINDIATANLHEHIFNFKIDLDIAGDLNRYSVEDIKLENISHPWFSNTTKRHMKIHKSLVKTELKNITNTFKTSQYHLFHNKNAKNKYGVDRAYRILNKSPVTDLLSGIDVTKAAAWSKYPIIVTRRKDAESRSSSIYAQNDPWNPVLDFDDFLDEESLVDKDLVAWVTMGTYHIPGTEDVPLTSTVWNQYSFFLAPHNYFWRSPDTEQVDTLKMRRSRNTNGEFVTDISQRHRPSSCIPPTQSDPSDYDGTRS